MSLWLQDVFAVWRVPLDLWPQSLVTALWSYWVKNKEEKHLNEFWLWCALDSVSFFFSFFFLNLAVNLDVVVVVLLHKWKTTAGNL